MKKTISAVFVSMAIVSSLSAQATSNLEVDNTFTHTGTPMCIPVNSSVDVGTVDSSTVLDAAFASEVGGYTSVTGFVPFNVQISNCARGTPVEIKAEGIVDTIVQGQTFGVTVGTGKSEMFAVVHVMAPFDAVAASNDTFSASQPTIKYVIEDDDLIPMVSGLLVRGIREADGNAAPGTLSMINNIGNDMLSIKSTYTITLL